VPSYVAIVSAVQGQRTSRPVTARPMIRRWISLVPSKMVNLSDVQPALHYAGTATSTESDPGSTSGQQVSAPPPGGILHPAAFHQFLCLFSLWRNRNGTGRYRVAGRPAAPPPGRALGAVKPRQLLKAIGLPVPHGTCNGQRKSAKLPRSEAVGALSLPPRLTFWLDRY
jgi:hypothetical protein